MDIFVTPFKIVNDPLVCQLLFHDEQVLKEVDDALIDVEVIKLGNHRLLILQVSLVLVDQCVALVDHRLDVIESLPVGLSFQLG